MLIGECFDVKPWMVLDRSKRDAVNSSARKGVMWALRATHGLTWREIGDVFGLTASTCCQAVGSASQVMAESRDYRSKVHRFATAIYPLNTADLFQATATARDDSKEKKNERC